MVFEIGINYKRQIHLLTMNIPEIRIKWIKGTDKFKDAYSVRKDVFVIEQKIEETFEIDEYDSLSTHLIIYDNIQPVATGRIFEQGDKFVIGRICVIKEYRKKSLGTLMMQELIKKAISMGARTIHLSSQVNATGFYRKFGFREYGETYDDAGIEHISMTLRIKGERTQE